MNSAGEKYLLASHGTIGAKAAEQKTFDICDTNSQVTHLVVVPEFWKGMLGDDWLNNSSTRIQFGHYLESLLEEEVDQNISRVREQFNHLDIQYTAKVVMGNPEECLLKIFNEFVFDAVVIGSQRPKNMQGLYSRMLSNTVTHKISAKLIQVSHPNA